MNSEQRNENVLNQIRTTISNYNNYSTYGLAAAGAAVLGGALYYYLNNTSSSVNLLRNIIDHKNQSRELEVNIENNKKVIYIKRLTISI